MIPTRLHCGSCGVERDTMVQGALQQIITADPKRGTKMVISDCKDLYLICATCAVTHRPLTEEELREVDKWRPRDVEVPPASTRGPNF